MVTTLMPNKCPYLLPLILIFPIVFNVITYAQVNTENLRRDDLSEGFHNTLQLDFSLVSGNSDFLNLKSSVRTDYLARDFYSFGVLLYQRTLQNKKVFINRGFIHLRGIYNFSGLFSWELFIQKEFNDFISLKDRNLIGSGLRKTISLLDMLSEKPQSLHLYLGIGMMWENEKLSTTPAIETKILRSTNYISLLWHLDERLSLDITVYYQIYLKNFDDYRVLLESNFVFNITQALAFQTSFNLRYDSIPPEDIKTYDLEINNGIRLAF